MKSTNVRLVILSTLLRAVGKVSPRVAAAWMERLFLSVRRHPVPEMETRWMEGSREIFVESGGQRLAARVFGEDGPTILLSHGWEGRGSQLGAFVRPLRSRGFRVVTFDHPGHGTSEGSRSNLPAMGRAVTDVGRELGPIHGVLAHSAGCAATTLALREGLRPERLVYVAPPTDLEIFFYRTVSALRIDRALGELAQRRIERRIGVRWADLRHAAIAPLQNEPLLIVHDRGDRETPVEGAREIRRLWRGSRLLETEGLGHRRILRDASVIEAAVSFLSIGREAERDLEETLAIRRVS